MSSQRSRRMRVLYRSWLPELVRKPATGHYDSLAADPCTTSTNCSGGSTRCASLICTHPGSRRSASPRVSRCCDGDLLRPRCPRCGRYSTKGSFSTRACRRALLQAHSSAASASAAWLRARSPRTAAEGVAERFGTAEAVSRQFADGERGAVCGRGDALEQRDRRTVVAIVVACAHPDSMGPELSPRPPVRAARSR